MAEALAQQKRSLIEARELTRRFGSFVAVNSIDIAVEAGEVFGLLGANGAGKTTAIRMLCGTLPPSGGSICVAGRDMARHARQARGRIGYVAQRFALYGDLNVKENLQLQAGLYGLDRKQSRERIDWALQHLSLKEIATRMAGGLPLGFQRRMALAAALLHKPEVLFLDEPTSGVDPIARQQFWELIYDLADSGIAILVTTHYMDEALFCDRIALMDAGKIIAEDTPADLMTRPLPTPLIALHSANGAQLSAALREWPEVLEIIPHSGQLRIRLQPGSDSDAVIKRIRDLAEKQNIAVDDLGPTGAELEDVFVALLEESQRQRGVSR